MNTYQILGMELSWINILPVYVERSYRQMWKISIKYSSNGLNNYKNEKSSIEQGTMKKLSKVDLVRTCES